MALDEGSARWWETGTVTLTELGRSVLAGKTDHVRLAGIDEWRGGVHLTGAEPAWRWDVETERLRDGTS